MLLHVAGGRVEIKTAQMLHFDSNAEITIRDDPISHARIMELHPSKTSASAKD
jgi:hypothetical protein